LEYFDDEIEVPRGMICPSGDEIFLIASNESILSTDYGALEIDFMAAVQLETIRSRRPVTRRHLTCPTTKCAMTTFPINPWFASEQDVFDAINTQTANMNFESVPVLAIAALRSGPSKLVVERLIEMGACPDCDLNGESILQLVLKKKDAPDWLHSIFRPIQEARDLEAVTGGKNTAIKRCGHVRL
jgi:hypothetical protein